MLVIICGMTLTRFTWTICQGWTFGTCLVLAVLGFGQSVVVSVILMWRTQHRGGLVYVRGVKHTKVYIADYADSVGDFRLWIDLQRYNAGCRYWFTYSTSFGLGRYHRVYVQREAVLVICLFRNISFPNVVSQKKF